MKLRRSACVPAAIAACLAFAGSADASEEHAQEVLSEAQALLGGDGADGTPTEEVTLVLGELAAVTGQLEGDDRRIARAILARPDDGASDRYGDGYTVDEAAESPECDTNFCVHWVASTRDAPDPEDSNGTDDGDEVPDVVEDVLESAELSHDVENGTLGWTEPLSDGTRGGGGAGLTDIYLIETGGSYFGYASPDEGLGSAVSKYAYLVLDEDMEEFVDAELTALESFQVTMAHEYNHVLQFTYDSLNGGSNLWALESTATWVEDYVYPGINDYLRYVGAFAEGTTTPLTADDGGVRIYGAALWNHYLSETDSPDVIRTAWEDIDTVSPAHRAVAAYDSALGGDGAIPFDDLGDTFGEFAAATTEWRVASAPFPDPADLPDASRSGKIGVGRAQRFRLDHLAYGLLKVKPALATSDLTLKLNCPEEVHCAAALVARTGSATGGAALTELDSAAEGGVTTVTLSGGAYSRITAVVANADGAIKPTGRYPADDSRFKVKLTPG